MFSIEFCWLRSLFQSCQSRLELFGAALEFLGMLRQGLASQLVRDLFREPARVVSPFAKCANVLLEPRNIFLVAHGYLPALCNVGY